MTKCPICNSEKIKILKNIFKCCKCGYINNKYTIKNEKPRKKRKKRKRILNIKMENAKLLNKIYAYINNAKNKAYLQYANDKVVKEVIYHIFWELDNFFMRLEDELKVENDEFKKY